MPEEKNNIVLKKNEKKVFTKRSIPGLSGLYVERTIYLYIYTYYEKKIRT